MTTKARFTALLVMLAGFAAPAAALDNSPMGTVTKAGLEAKGYTCVVVSVGFWECTKQGETTYWCDAGSCQPKPRTMPPVRKLPQVNLGTKIFTN